MFRIAATLIFAGLTGLGLMSAPEPHSRTDLVGTWTGPFKADQGTGEATLVLTKEEGYAATFSIKVEHPVTMGDITDLKVGEQTISWSQRVMDLDCTGEATLEAALLKGGLNCGTFAISFELTKS